MIKPRRLLLIALTSISGAGILSAQTRDTTGLGMLRLLDSLRTANAAEYDTLRTILMMSVQMTLGRLGFGPSLFTGVADEETIGAVRRYQVARKLPATGDPFSPSTYARLNAEATLVKETDRRPYLGQKLFHWTDEWVIAEGPWLLEGEANNYMTAHITCERERLVCRVAWARLGIGPGLFNSWALQILTESFTVARWDQSEIISEPLDYPCVRYTLRLNRLQESAVMTRSTLSRTGFVCEALDVRDVVTQLVRPEDWPSAKSPSDNPLNLYNLGPVARAVLRMSEVRPPE